MAKGRPVRRVEDGAVYPSANAAARELGVARTTVYQSINQGLRAGGYHWEFIDDDPDRTSPGSPIAVRCLQNGQVFCSVRNAVLVLTGRPPSNNDYTRFRAGLSVGGYDFLPLDDDEPKPKRRGWSTRAKPVVCRETGKVYPSAAAAAAAVHADSSGVRHAANRGVSCRGFHWAWFKDPRIERTAS